MIREISEEELALQQQYMVDGAGAFSGAKYREGWVNQIVFSLRTREYATVWIFGNRGPQYLLWASSTDGTLDLEEIVWEKKGADKALNDFLNAMKNETILALNVYQRKENELQKISLKDLKKKKEVA